MRNNRAGGKSPQDGVAMIDGDEHRADDYCILDGTIDH
jgi:hypothetical protein